MVWVYEPEILYELRRCLEMRRVKGVVPCVSLEEAEGCLFAHAHGDVWDRLVVSLQSNTVVVRMSSIGFPRGPAPYIHDRGYGVAHLVTPYQQLNEEDWRFLVQCGDADPPFSAVFSGECEPRLTAYFHAVRVEVQQQLLAVYILCQGYLIAMSPADFGLDPRSICSDARARVSLSEFWGGAERALRDYLSSMPELRGDDAASLHVLLERVQAGFGLCSDSDIAVVRKAEKTIYMALVRERGQAAI